MLAGGIQAPFQEEEEKELMPSNRIKNHGSSLCFVLVALLCLLRRWFLVGQAVGARPLVPGAEDAVPEGEEGLGEIGLDSPGLVVDVVIGSIVACDELERIPGELVATVVVNSLDGREAEEQGALANVHARKLETDASTKAIEEEALKGVVVEGAIGVRHV